MPLIPRTLISVAVGFFLAPIAWAATESAPVELPGAEAFVYHDVGSSASETLRLFVVKPKDWKASDRRAALVFFFGGGWTTGTPRDSISWARFAAEHGMVGIAPDYRTKGRHDTSPLASVSDGRAAVTWLQKHADELGLDAARIVVGGESAGGHVALWTAIERSPPGSDDRDTPRPKPAALILFSAVSDTSESTGYTPQRFGENARELSPVHQLGSKMPPVLAFHGDADKLVPLAQATTLRDKLNAAGSACELIIVPGGGHNFDKSLPDRPETAHELVLKFLAKYHLVDSATKP